jgi:hypothetical protein
VYWLETDVLVNLVIVVHLAYFVFVVGGFFCILIGARLGWKWIRNPWFRIAHLLSVFIVLVEDRLAVNCPLNVLESSLRSPGGEAAQAPAEPISVLDQLLHHTISERVLDALYWTLGPLLVLLLFLVRPKFRARSPN